MTTFKKLAFCSACTFIILGATPKIEAGLKDEAKKEKKITEESSLNKSLTTQFNTTGTIAKIVFGGFLFVGCTFLSETLKNTYKITALAAGLFGVVAGVGIIGWGIRDIIVWEKKYKALA